MKKISVILLPKEKNDFLAEMQKTGLLQIIEEHEKTSENLEEKIEYYQRLHRIARELKAIEKKHKKEKLPPQQAAPEVILREYDRLHENRVRLGHELEKLEMEEGRLRPWGNFRMEDIHRLREHGVYSHFYTASVKNFRKIDFGDVAYEIVKQDKKLVYFIVFSKERMNLPANEVHLPDESLDRIARKIFILVNEIRTIDRSLFELSAYADSIVTEARNLKNSISFEQASMVCESDGGGNLVFINAWLVAENQKKIETILERFTIWYEIEEPELEETPPVQLRNNWFVRPFEAITRIFSLPSYFEVDPTPLFAPFFMLFFGLCMADMGYGLLLLTALVIARFKTGEDLRPILNLGIILGVFTVVSGYWLNTFFGFSIFRTPGMENAMIPGDSPADFLANYMEDGKMIFPAMSFALVVGVIQVSFGIFISMMNRMREKGFLHGLQSISYLVMIAGILVIAAHRKIMGVDSVSVGNLNIGSFILLLPATSGSIMLYAGLALLLLFNNVDKKIWVRPPLGLWELYNFVSGIIGDTLSYLRLFALGLAGGLLGGAFNNIAFMVMKGDADSYSVVGVFFGVLIMVLGHSLNIILAVMGAFVHSLRLTFVEFYKNLQFGGGGKPFAPFRLEK